MTRPTFIRVRLLKAVQELYAEQPVQPPVRAAILRVLAELPGLRHDDGVTTELADHSCVRVGIDSDRSGLPSREILIFDVRTGKLLGAEHVLTRTPGKLSVPIPCVISRAIYLNAGRTDELEPPE